MDRNKIILEKRQMMFYEGFEHLLNEGKHQEITEEIIWLHLNEWKHRKPTGINGRCGLFYKMLEHAQNRNFMPNVIGNIYELRKVLLGFDPKLVLKKYESNEESWRKLLDSIKMELSLGNINDENGHWVVFSKSIISIADFLSKFDTINEFNEFVYSFDKNDDARIELALLLEKEIFGYGFALACDFLKENYSPRYAKPDIHINRLFNDADIAKELSLSINCKTNKEKTRVDIDTFRAIVEYSESINRLPYEADKLFWLIGSGNFYLVNIKIKTSMDDFIEIIKDKFALKNNIS